jgi:hypothetical protein
MNNTIKRISEIIPKELFPETTRIRFQDLLNKDLVILDAVSFTNKWGRESVVLKLKILGEETEYSTITSAQVLVKKILYLLEHQELPCIASIVKVKNYYDLV